MGNGDLTYITDWSSVAVDRYDQAQRTERAYWDAKDRERLVLDARLYYYSGYYQWSKRRGLLNPYRVDPDRPQNFQLLPDEVHGRRILDAGCGPRPWTLSLVHCAEVHALDPLLDHYRELQPFGWHSFETLTAAGAERLPFADATFDFVHCWNVLDHTQDADAVVDEFLRTLRPEGELLIGCDVRADRPGGPGHPYNWGIETLEGRLLRDLEPVTPITFLDDSTGRVVARDDIGPGVFTWIARLKKKG